MPHNTARVWANVNRQSIRGIQHSQIKYLLKYLIPKTDQTGPIAATMEIW